MAIRLALALLLLLVGCGDDRAARAEPTTDEPDEVEQRYGSIPQDGVRLGSPDAAVTLVEFADLQCPFCGHFSREVLPTVVDAYVAKERIAFELRIRAFIGRDSVRAAGAAAVAARQDRLFQFADHFYREQGPENSGYVTNAFVRGIAQQVPGLEIEPVVEAANDPLAQPLVHRVQRQAEQIGSTGTPDFYVRRGTGRLVPFEPEGTSPEAFTRALDAALR